MKLIRTTMIWSATLGLLASAVQAVPIQGSIEFNLDQNSFSFDSTSVDFAAGDSGNVNDASGDYAGLVGSDVVFKDFVHDPFAGPIESFWSIPGADISFDLLDLFHHEYSMVGGARFLTLAGTGIVRAAGFDPTAGIWTFSADKDGGSYNYSSIQTSVPEGGSVLALFGLSLLGLAIASRRSSESATPVA